MSSLTGARVAVAAAFFAQGFVFISLTTRLPRFLDRWGLDEVALSGLLLMMVLLAGVGSLVAEHASRRTGSAVLLRLAFVLMLVAVPGVVLAPAFAVFVGGVAVYGLALGLVDAGSNMQGVALEERYGRPILPSSHGWWTTGGILAAGASLATGHLPLTVGAAVAVVPLLAALAPYLPRTAPATVPARAPMPGLIGTAGPGVTVVPSYEATPAAPATTPAPAEPVPWRPIWLVGLGLVVFYMVDTAASTWGPVYLATSLGASASLVPLATFPYLVSAIVVRLAGDALVTRFGATRLLRAGAVVAFAALVLIVFAPSLVTAVVGFAVLGGAVALVAPLSFSAAGRIAGAGSGSGSGPSTTTADRARVDAVIARFNQFNYVGALLGAVLTGLVGGDNLRLGFVLPAVLVLALVPLAPAFARGALRRG